MPEKIANLNLIHVKMESVKTEAHVQATQHISGKKASKRFMINMKRGAQKQKYMSTKHTLTPH